MRRTQASVRSLNAATISWIVRRLRAVLGDVHPLLEIVRRPAVLEAGARGGSDDRRGADPS